MEPELVTRIAADPRYIELQARRNLTAGRNFGG